MKLISIWARCFKDSTIAVDGEIPWKYSSDFKRFKYITEGSVVICGRKTYETLPNRTLPNRKIIVLSSNEKYEVSDKENHKVMVDYKLIPYSKYIWGKHEPNVFIIGGSKIYELFLTDEKLKPDYIIDCQIREVAVVDKLDAIEESKKIKITKATENSLRENYAHFGVTSSQDSIYNYLYVRKDKTMEHLIDGITKVF